MVTLAIPSVSSDVYCLWSFFLFGPWTETGGPTYSIVDVPFSFQGFTQGDSFYGEKAVHHVKAEGQLSVLPSFSGFTPSPTVTYPNRGTVVLNGTTYDVNRGIATTGRVETTVQSLTSKTKTCFGYLDETGWTYYYVSYNPAFPKSSRVLRRFTITVLSTSRTRFSIRIHQESRDSNITHDQDLENITSNELISLTEDYFSEFPGVVTVSTTTIPAGHMSNLSVNPSALSSFASSMMDYAWSAIDKKAPVHFGELAMEASERVNATRINVLQFLKDLRHPSSLIPKLKGLKQLKAAANTYLTINYGILPTIHDVNNIRLAFDRIKPYVDTNGYSIFKAGRLITVPVSDSLAASHEQHLKLALDDEDSELLSLLRRIEEWGVFPSFQNIWDLIPYSFVIDWLIDVGDFLARVDTRLRLMRLNVRYVTMSHKVSVYKTFHPYAEKPISGTVTMVRYHRGTTDQCPVPPISLQEGSGLTNHWLEGSALFIQRARK